MLHRVARVDADGFFLSDELTDSPGPQHIPVPAPPGLVLPRWVDGSWTEGRTPEEIAALRAQAAAIGVRRASEVQSSNFCAADGVADDTSGLQAAVDAAMVGGRTLHLSGVLRTTAPIALPSGRDNPLSIVGRTFDANTYGPTPLCTVRSSGPAVFACDDDTNLRMRGVQLRNEGGPSAAVFSGGRLQSSRLSNIQATNYGAFLAGTDLSFTRVQGCDIQSLWQAFTTGRVVDSWIVGNYLNGKPAANATAFAGGELATSLVTGNYVDFFKRVFDQHSSQNAVQVSGNTIEYCWQIFGSSHPTQHLNGWVVANNRFLHMSGAESLPYFTSADAEMREQPFSVLTAGGGVSGSLFHGNVIGRADVGFKIRGGSVRALGIRDNLYLSVETPIDFAATWYGQPGEGQDIYLDAIHGIRVAELPAPGLSGGTIVSYDGHEVIVGHVRAWNDAGTWRNALGAPL